MGCIYLTKEFYSELINKSGISMIRRQQLNTKTTDINGHWRGCCFLLSLPCLSKVFSLAPWLLLDLTGLNWRQLEILEKMQDRQTESEVRYVVCLAGDTQHSFLLYLDSLRPYSLQFFKTLLQTSFLRLALSHVCS
jgi:hypothetical protein